MNGNNNFNNSNGLDQQLIRIPIDIESLVPGAENMSVEEIVNSKEFKDHMNQLCSNLSNMVSGNGFSSNSSSSSNSTTSCPIFQSNVFPPFGSNLNVNQCPKNVHQSPACNLPTCNLPQSRPMTKVNQCPYLSKCPHAREYVRDDNREEEDHDTEDYGCEDSTFDSETPYDSDSGSPDSYENENENENYNEECKGAFKIYGTKHAPSKYKDHIFVTIKAGTTAFPVNPYSNNPHNNNPDHGCGRIVFDCDFDILLGCEQFQRFKNSKGYEFTIGSLDNFKDFQEKATTDGNNENENEHNICNGKKTFLIPGGISYYVNDPNDCGVVKETAKDQDYYLENETCAIIKQGVTFHNGEEEYTFTKDTEIKLVFN